VLGAALVLQVVVGGFADAFLGFARDLVDLPTTWAMEGGTALG